MLSKGLPSTTQGSVYLRDVGMDIRVVLYRVQFIHSRVDKTSSFTHRGLQVGLVTMNLLKIPRAYFEWFCCITELVRTSEFPTHLFIIF